MSFFNLTMMGYQSPIKTVQSNLNEPLPPINCPKEYLAHFSKPMNSNLKYHELRTKHIRDPRDPIDMYQRPLTNSQSIGWWIKDQPINQTQPWTKVKKYVFPKSEMTQFVHKMTLSDKSFRLY